MQDYSRLPQHSIRRLPQSMPEAHNGPATPMGPGPGSGRSYSPASGQSSAQGGPSGMLPMPMGGGQYSGQDWDAVGAGAGARSSSHLLQQQSSAHPEQPLPAPVLEKRPSDLLHAFAQVTSYAQSEAYVIVKDAMPIRSKLLSQTLSLKPLVPFCIIVAFTVSSKHVLVTLAITAL